MPKNGFYQGVVYLLIPTSNHNTHLILIHLMLLYIFWFLHQTTTCGVRDQNYFSCISFDSYIKPQLLFLMVLQHHCCISFDSYIKPQPLAVRLHPAHCCISFDSYIKPQLFPGRCHQRQVVYLLIPTSNHNCTEIRSNSLLLYIFWFLHQTTTSCR